MKRSVIGTLPTLLALLAVIQPASAVAPGRDAHRVALVDQAGASFSIATLAATRPVIYTFVATRCTDACPLANAIFGRLAARLAAKRLRATVVTVTLDPGYDTPFVMAREAQTFGADATIWKFASGSPRDIRRLMRADGVVTRLDEHGVPEEHSSFVYLQSPRLKRTFLLSSNLPDEILAAM